MAVLFANNYNTRLATSVLASSNTMMLVNPLPFIMTSKDSCYLTLVDFNNGVEVFREVVKVVATAGNEVTVQRGASATNWVANTVVEMRLVAEYFNNDIMSVADIRELIATQQEAIASLGSASAAFGSQMNAVLSESSVSPTELTWTTTTPSSNTGLLDLGVNSIIFKRSGSYSFLNNLVFTRSDGSNQQFAVIFEMYNANTLEVIGTATKYLNMANNTNSEAMFNASVTIDEVLDNPVVMKVRAYTSATDGIVKLIEFSSIVISKAAGIGGGGASGNGGNEVFYENDTAITTSYDITTGKNAMTAGPVVINTNVEVVVPVGSSWTIV